MLDRPRWLPYRARDGVLETFFESTTSDGSFSSYVTRAIAWSQPAEVGSYRLLDSFLSDSMTVELFTKIFSLSSSTHPVQILIADPSSDFALARAKSIGQIAAKEVRIGVSNILRALCSTTRIEIPQADTLTFEELVSLCQTHAEKVHLELRFYSEAPSGPLYFFKDILLSGRFCAGRSSSRLPWSMIIDDPRYTGDLYDVYREEFELIWKKSNPFPETTIGTLDKDSAKKSSPESSEKPLFDLGIVTATEVEWKALWNLPGARWSKLQSISEGGSIFYGATFEENGRRLSVIATRQTEPGMVCAAIAATKMLQLCRISFLANIGICAAVPRRARLGSIIIANQVSDVQAGKFVDGTLQPNADSISLDLSLVQMIRESGSTYSREAETIYSDLAHPKGPVPIVIGKIATVSQVIADSSFAQQFWNHSRKCVALEMESYAIFRAAAEAKSERRPRTLFIKAATDYADGHKNDRYQDFCAAISAHFLWRFSIEHLAR